MLIHKLTSLWVLLTFLLWEMLLLWTSAIHFCVDLFSFLLGISMGIEFRSHLVTLYLTSWGNVKLPSQSLELFHIPSSRPGGIWFFSILPSTSFQLPFWLPPSWQELSGISLWIWHLLYQWPRMLGIFPYTFCVQCKRKIPLQFFFGDMSVQILGHSLNQAVGLFTMWESFTYSRCKSLNRYAICK